MPDNFMSYNFNEKGTVTLSETEWEKATRLLYASSGVRCYNKDHQLINPYDEFPEYYTVNVTADYHALLYDLSVNYQRTFPEPSEQKVIEILTKGQSQEARDSGPDWKTVGYFFIHTPEYFGKQGDDGFYIEAEDKETDEICCMLEMVDKGLFYQVKPEYLDWWKAELRASYLSPNDEGLISEYDLEFYVQDLDIPEHELMDKLMLLPEPMEIVRNIVTNVKNPFSRNKTKKEELPF